MSAKQCPENIVLHWTVRKTLRINITTLILAFYKTRETGYHVERVTERKYYIKTVTSLNIILSKIVFSLFGS